MVNGKNKGNTFERKIANLFSSRFKEITNLESAFKRNPDSGSFFGGINENRIKTHGTEFAFFGDIIAPKDFKFVIECKHYKTAPGMMTLINQTNKQWNAWIEQSSQSGRNANLPFLLIIKYNNCQEIVITDAPFESHIQYKGYNLITLDELLQKENNIFF